MIVAFGMVDDVENLYAQLFSAGHASGIVYLKIIIENLDRLDIKYFWHIFTILIE